MKNILACIFALAFTPALAQSDLMNGSFEDTAIIYDNGIPDTVSRHWTMSQFGAGITQDARTGNSAAIIWNWYYYLPGELTNGDAVLPKQGGTPVSFSPTRLSGYYKYIEGDIESQNDSAQAIICVTRYNAAQSKRDTLGYGIKKLPPADVYTPFELDVNYTGSSTPDSVTVKFISSVNGFCTNASAGNCLHLYLDDVSVSDLTSDINEKIVFNHNFIAFPNPASDLIQFRTGEAGVMVIYNAVGEIILEQNIPSGEIFSTDISGLPPGIYHIRLNEKAGRFVKQ